MTSREMQGAFQYETNKYDEIGIVTSDLIFYWLNNAIEHFVKSNYSNTLESFEETQRITDNLKNLVVEAKILPSSAGVRENSYLFTLPADYMHAVSEEVEISTSNPNAGGSDIINREGVTNSSSTIINKQIKDPYNPYHLHYDTAQPLRLFIDNYAELVTDGNYTIEEYFLRYLKQPLEIDLDNDLTELPENTHADIVKLAAMLYLQSVGISINQPTQQPQSNNN